MAQDTIKIPVLGYPTPVEFPAGTSQEEIEKALRLLPPAPPPVMQINDAQLDKVTGAPKGLRAALAATPKPQDKLGLVQKYFPGAMAYGDDNFVYTNPKTSRQTLVNPKGPDWGDVAEYGRIPAEILGGAVGTALGTPGGPPGMVGGGIAGSQAGGEAYDALLRSLYGSTDTRTMGERAQNVGTGAAIDLATLGAGKVLGPAVRKVFGSKEGVEAGKAAERLGMGDMPTGTVSGRGLARVESAVQQTMAGAKAVDNAYAAAVKDLEAALQRIAGQGAGMSPQAAGQSVLDAANAFKTKFDMRSNDLFNKVGDLMPSGQMFDANATKAAIRNLTGAGVDSAQLAQRLAPTKTIEDLQALFGEAGQASYNDMKRLRTSIGLRLAKPQNLDGNEEAMLKQAYAALSDDMTASATLVGGETARAAQKANRFYRVGAQAIETQIDPLIKSGRDVLDPEKIFGRLNLGSKTQQQTLGRQLDAFVPPNVQQQVGGVQLSQLGGETFSPAKLVSGLEKLRAGTGQLPPTMRGMPSIDDAETVARAFNRSASTVNRSNTSGSNFLLGGMGAAGGAFAGSGDLGTTAMGLVAAQGIPGAVSYLIQTPIVRQILSDTVSDSTAKVARLMSLGLNEPLARATVEGNYNQPSLLQQVGQ